MSDFYRLLKIQDFKMGKILKYLIDIQHETNVAEVGLAEEREWCFFKEVWADVRVRSGGTEYAQEGPMVFTRVEFTVRYDEEIDYNKRIKYNNQQYVINHIEPIDRMHWMRIISVNWQDD